MNSQQLFATMLMAMSDDAPQQAQDWGDWFTLGELDGEDGAPCDPLFYGCTTVANCEQYVLGWREGMHVEDTDELVSYREDVEWMRTGC